MNTHVIAHLNTPLSIKPQVPAKSINPCQTHNLYPKTCTCTCRYRYSWVWVQVAEKNPRVTHEKHYQYPYIAHLIVSRKAENAVQVTKTLYNIIEQPLLSSTIQFHLRKAAVRAIVKSKCSHLFVAH